MAARWDLDRARALDRDDPLAKAREHFVLPAGIVYLNGNSLGALSKSVGERVQRLIDEEWGVDLGTAWHTRGWMDAPLAVGDRIAPLIGAGPGEVLAADTTSIALAKMLGAALAARPGRRVILSSTDNFPSDLFSAAGVARRAGAELRVVDKDDLPAALDQQTAVCCLTQVDFRTGRLHDLPALTDAAHEVGALALWDLCHSAGAVPVGCEEHGVDLAVGCTYKYLNGGPGSPSFIYVRSELQDQLENPLPGWLGHDSPFGFELEWRPARGVKRFLTSTPPVLALAALDAALDAFDGVTIESVREKSVALSSMLIDIVSDSVEVASPLQPEERGSQVSLRHPAAAALVEAALQRGVLADFRAPDLVRFGMSPLYLSFENVFQAARTVVALAH